MKNIWEKWTCGASGVAGGSLLLSASAELRQWRLEGKEIPF